MESLYEKLTSYSESDYYGFHMPGHKRNTHLMDENLPYQIDITEIEGFDDLHHADGILKDEQELAAKVYHADETHFLINGSTAGILSAIMGSVSRGEKILVARNCHKSVYHAIFMKELKPVYLYPEFYADLELNGEVKATDVEMHLQADPEIKAVVIVSPTYDGVISDIEAIAKVAHAHGVPLIVDEAHGAHLGFHSYFPENANTKGADIVIHSLHKTLPALTQTALLHINGELVDRASVKQYLDMLQTSSPSYVLMASIDACIQMLAKNMPECDGEIKAQGAFSRADEQQLREKDIFGDYVQLLSDTRERLSQLKNLKIIETEHYDKSKIVISVKNVGGVYTSKQLYQELLDTYHLQMEMAAGSYVLAMTAVGDTKEGMDRLVKALLEIDERLGGLCKAESQSASLELHFAESIGYISKEYAYVYPPGIPILVPGEMVTQDAVDELEKYAKLGFRIEGLKEENKIEVWING